MRLGVVRRVAVAGVLAVAMSAIASQAAFATALAPSGGPDAVSVQLATDLYLQDLTTPGDHGVVTISGCISDVPLSPLELTVTFTPPAGGTPSTEVYSFTTPDVATLPLSTVQKWLTSEQLLSGGTVGFDALCTFTGEVASATLESSVLAFTLPEGTTVASLASSTDPGMGEVGICRDAIVFEADYSYQLAPGMNASIPVAEADLEVDAQRGAQFPLAVLSEWLQQEMPTAGGTIDLTATCASPPTSASVVIPADSDVGEAPPPSPVPSPSPSRPPVDGVDAAPPAAAPTTTAAPALAETGGPSPLPALALTFAAAIFVAAGMALRISTRDSRAARR